MIHIIRKVVSVVTLMFLFMALTLTPNSFLLSKASAAATTLGAAMRAHKRIFGVGITGGGLNMPTYANVVATQFTSLTPSNEMKWDATEPSQNSFNFGAADAIVKFAQSHHIKVRGHTLVWHSQLAGWVNNISSSPQLLQAMRNHIAKVAGHFKGEISYWDVVNEAFQENGSRRASIFQRVIGDSFIEEAFKAAHQADPQAKLCYNDYNIEGINPKSNGVYAMVRSFRSRHVPIDCIGIQGHLIAGQIPSGIQANLQRFAKLGLSVQFTELDIRMPVPTNNVNLQKQAQDYQAVILACLAVSRCAGVTVWNVYDGDSWVPSTFPGYGAATLFDNNYNKRPAYYSILSALNR
jgi:endo-1,4-beta-xylanase